MLESLKPLKAVLGPRLNPDTVDEPDKALIDLAVPAVKALMKYFRAEVIGLENMPAGKALLVGNHNAGITDPDPFFLGAEWHLKSEGKDPIYALAHDAMVALPVVGNFLLRLGCIRASHETARKAFEMGHKVLVYPGGNFEAFRTFKDRYKVDFGGKKGFIKLALRAQVPIVPILAIGGHETFVVLHRGEKLAEMLGVKKYLRSESFPIFLGLPWGLGFGPIFHLPLPARILVEVGKPISLEGYTPADADNPEKLEALYAQVVGQLQEMMDKRAADRRFPVLG